ncbi:bifunctional phosphatase PAP2/diacylglycerol kinase family protein [Nocardia huaxiensis]|uniref:bifunctional phosphatase PAP2/diacylglycerol kinase family protein n=1 Tax=Nocardia huaxiensis TaxID=2755382 RepID=UPI001E2EAEE1|nr:bifunctional phosphatase PAP2/diacylglycerol kinase family protein [Nocardia huaxiensis]UFS93812.1 phosphatase PAP2 family protein [Nocardia huaxiensis]
MRSSTYPPRHRNALRRMVSGQGLVDIGSVGAVSGWLDRKFHRVGRFDRAVENAVGALPASKVDVGMLRLTRTANYSGLWLGIAAALATRKGATRRAALRGTVSVAGASLVVNAGMKMLIARRRPAAEVLPVHRRLVPAPLSSSFPSGHSACAAAFATAVALESPRTALVVAPLAATVAYSRVHTGVHWSSDVFVGAAVGSAVALATQRWWPVRESDEALARPVREAPAMPYGKGLVVVVNPVSGDPNYDPFDDIAEALPQAVVLRTQKDLDAAEQLEQVLAELGGAVQAVGVAGGDGTVAAIAAVALRHKLPLAVVPTGTLNHFARDLGVYDLIEVVDATSMGEAVAVDVASVELEDETGSSTRYLLNTASIGTYPDMVRMREKWQHRWGKWPAFAAALVVTLHRAESIRIQIDGRWQQVWFLFIGNGPYHPHGAVPAFRDRLDSGLLDIRWIRADVRWSRTRAFLALALSAIGHSKVYGERQLPELLVDLPSPEAVATDGEVVGKATRLHFRMAGQIPVYRRDESNPRWADRIRPHHRRAPWLRDAFQSLGRWASASSSEASKPVTAQRR